MNIVHLWTNIDAYRRKLSIEKGSKSNESKPLHMIEHAQYAVQTWKTHTHTHTQTSCWGGMVEADELTDTGHDAM